MVLTEGAGAPAAVTDSQRSETIWGTRSYYKCYSFDLGQLSVFDKSLEGNHSKFRRREGFSTGGGSMRNLPDWVK